MYPYTNPTGKMKVSQAMPLLNIIANDWKLPLHCNAKEQKMVCFGHSFKIASRILNHSAKNN